MLRSPYHQEQITDGLLYQKYRPHIHSLTFTNMSNETVDAAYEIITALNREYAENKQHLQLLYILDDVQYTPYMLTKILQSLKTVTASLRHSTAVVADNFLTDVLQAMIFPKLDISMKQAIHFFATEAEAFKWLDERRKTMGE